MNPRFLNQRNLWSVLPSFLKIGNAEQVWEKLMIFGQAIGGVLWLPVSDVSQCL